VSRDVAAHARRRRARSWLLAGVLAVVSVACLGAALTHSAVRQVTGIVSTASTSSVPRVTVAGTPLARAVPARRAPSPARSRPPVHLSIPAIGVSEPLLRLGLHADRTVEVPAPRDAAYPGWFRLGPTPGQVGSAVILGHVDSLTGPAVFYELRRLARGDRVDVRLEGGAVTHFEVREVATYRNRDFPAQKVYGSHGYPGLNLVTCGGDYEKDHGGYQANVVAFTRQVR
jgi:hypothetical protein